MKCKTCKAEIPAENINIQLAIAKCSYCNTVFSFLDEVATPQSRRKPQDVGLPKGLTIESTEHELRIRRRWFSALTIILTGFAAFWDTFIVAWFLIALSGGEYAMAAAGSLHALVGIGITYYVLAGYLNSTLVAVNRENLIVYHTPLPWPGTKTISSSDVSQLYCKSVRSGSRSRSYSYEVRVRLRDDRDLKLLSGLTEDAQALYIEQEVERYLRIKDAPMRGELNKD